ncbi:MAG: tRNA-dihydrouridine synthase [Candidatus Jorgensenbacteria bacterium]|nr:tRNA-dihydrouridine synthase [Candidatus Jorgensenbacteria bacterium]
MVQGFWKKLKRPFFALAPMSDVTDAAFRRIVTKYGKPDILWTEFVPADGLCSKGRKAFELDLSYTKKERPIVAQLFGATPEHFYKSARILQKLGFDGIDINMGCPDRKILKQGAGAALIENPKLAREIIKETKRGAESAGRRIPVSVKTRIGDAKNEIKKWLPYLLEAEPSAITIHARTRKGMSDVPADWSVIKEAVKIAHKYDSSPNRTLIIGNGDVKNLTEAKARAKETGADGVMIGRGIFGNPWFFYARRKNPPTVQEKLRVAIEHAKLFEKIFHKKKNFDVMKKHLKAYISGFDGAKELRTACMVAKTGAEAEKAIKSFLYSGIERA